jgi:biopolymer transport protein ExbD
MTIAFPCPHCQFEIKAKDRHAGTRSKCPSCNRVIVVPGAASETIAEGALSASAASPEVELPAPTAASAMVVETRGRWRALAPAPVSATHAPSTNGQDHEEEEEEEHRTGALIPHKEGSHEDLIDMTPMVDIVFFLLIFFLTTSLQALQAVMDLPTPQTATDSAASRSVSDLASDSDTLMVKIQEDDTFWIDDEQVPSDQDLRMRIKAAKEETGDKPLALVVVGNADASHGAAIRVFDAGASAGVGSISLLVQEETD